MATRNSSEVERGVYAPQPLPSLCIGPLVQLGLPQFRVAEADSNMCQT